MSVQFLAWFLISMVAVSHHLLGEYVMSPDPAIIDIHCHTAGIGSGGSGCFVSSALSRNIRYRFFLKAFGVTESELLKHGDRLVLERLSGGLSKSRHVSSAVILAMDGVLDSQGNLDTNRTEIYIPNAFLARECQQIPHLLFGASINPYRRDALDLLDEVVANGAVLLKWLPSIQGIDPHDAKLDHFYRRLQELNLPLLTHTGTEKSFTRAANALSDPLKLRRALEAGVTVIAAHCASNGKNCGERNFDRLLSLFAEFPNLYADISSLTQLNRLGHLQKVLAHSNIHNRLLYGSDMPIISTGITSPWCHSLNVSLAEAARLSRIDNPWDRDVELKLALGMPKEMFEQKSFTLLAR